MDFSKLRRNVPSPQNGSDIDKATILTNKITIRNNSKITLSVQLEGGLPRQLKYNESIVVMVQKGQIFKLNCHHIMSRNSIVLRYESPKKLVVNYALIGGVQILEDNID